MKELRKIAFLIVARDDGATMVEYAIMLALIAAVSIGIVTILGTAIQGLFSNVNGF
jgi:pilus assembly protein Flp/PilA